MLQPASMRPGTSASTLLYVSGDKYSYSGPVVYVYSYPGGTLETTLSGFQRPRGLCTDKRGDVYITDQEAGKIVEYSHGGTTPITTLSDANQPDACFVDPQSGKLAVSNYSGSVSIYAQAKGKPRLYSIPWPGWFVAYDNAGNLFADGFPNGIIAIAELLKGSVSFATFNPGVRIKMPPAGLQWFGDRLTVGRQNPYQYGCCGKINRFIVQGMTGEKVGTTRTRQMLDYFIEGSTVVATSGYNRVEIFSYPKPGSSGQTIDTPGENTYGVVVSNAP